MIRHPLQATGRGRPDLQRVAEGIANSLRQFSTAQARYNDDNWSGGRQRSADAANELLGIDSDKPARSTSNSPAPISMPRTLGPQKIITMKALRGGTGGRFATRGAFSRGGSAGGGNMIRGGLPRPGGFSRVRFVDPRNRDENGDGPSSRGGRGGGFGARGGGGGGRGRGRRIGDDRPRRNNKGEKDGDENMNQSGYNAFKLKWENTDHEYERMVGEVEEGVDLVYNPSFNLEDLAGYAPAVATASSPLAQAGTVMFWERMVGGSQAYHPTHVLHHREAVKRYQEGEGVFFPTIEAKEWTSKVTGVEFKAPPEEFKTAMLESAFLGQYDGPKYVESDDILGKVRSYARKHGTYNGEAKRALENKVSSILEIMGHAGAKADSKSA